MSLTTKQQIKVLQSIDWKEMEKYNYSLCYMIRKAIKKFYPNKVISRRIISGNQTLLYVLEEAIPLFIYSNAIRFSSYQYHSEYDYWFSFNKQGHQERQAFVNWIISELKK